MNINIVRFAAVVSIALCFGEALAGRELSRNPPSACSGPGNKCGCPEKKVTAKCIKATVDLGETTPWTGSLECSLKIFADDDSPSIFTADSLYAVLGGYTFKRLGTQNLADGATPAEVVFSHPNGEPVHFVFAEGESLGRPDPGVHIKMDERLMMVDAEGWAATHDPVYYDLYIGDGSRRRFLATNMTGALGQLVSIVDARGVTTTPTDMGVDIVYDSNGVRQYLTPSRLANVTHTSGFSGYDVAVYALQEAPAKDAQTGLYAVPAAQPVERLSIQRENDGKRAVVTVQKGGGEALRYVFDYAMGEWSLTRPSGAQELRERHIADEREAKIVTSYVSSHGERLEHTEYNYKWESWGFAMTNRVEGFGGVTDTTEWTYYTSGNGKGQVKTEKRQSGLLIQYAYDNLDRATSETRSGPDMMTEVTTYDYTPVDPSDPVLPVDTRPRTIVKKLNNIECERTYYVYSPLTNIVERVGAQGAAYGGTNVLRTVTTFYPVSVGASLRDARSGFVASIRHEDGKLDLYDYELSSNCWIRTVTHLHEQSPLPVSGKTTRDITITNARGETSETRTEAFIDGIWYTIARNRMTYNFEGKRISSENLAGQITTTAWDCCHKVSEVQPDGSTTTWDYDIEGRMIAASRLIPLDMTNVTWLTTCYEYDDLGRQVATWQTNYTAQVGLPVTRTCYDQLGRVIARVDQLGNTTTTEYSPDGRTVFVRNPNTSTRVVTRSPNGDTLSITGSAVTPEFHTRGILPDGTRWSRTVQGETASSPRFAKRYENLLDQTIREERSGFRGAVLATVHSYDSLGRLVLTVADYEPTVEYDYDVQGVRFVSVSRADGQWRKTESRSAFVLRDSDVWAVQTNNISCSDVTIAPLSQSRYDRMTGLTSSCASEVMSTDVRGNIFESRVEFNGFETVSVSVNPAQTYRAETHGRFGFVVRSVAATGVESRFIYDELGRQVASTDGLGKLTRTEFDSLGRKAAIVDPDNHSTSYGYNGLGELVSVANSKDEVIVYRYDLRGRKIYEGGATYPIRYDYDIFGNKISMTTSRDEAGSSWDITRWFYDEASGSMTNKVYANEREVKYDYDTKGRLVKYTLARGITIEYSYDSWGKLINTDYSDDTPSVVLSYDMLGRQMCAIDAAGVTTFSYDIFGALTNETVIGVAGTNTIEHFYDAFGRDMGYALNGVRQSTLSYDPATGRIASMLVTGSDTPFTWNYIAGSDLKSSLSYPNGLTASWVYGNSGELLEVDNAFPVGTVSKYVYAYDTAGRRISCAKSGSAFDAVDTISYFYNARGELTNAIAAVDSDYRFSYCFDDIGNRKTAIERGTNTLYFANSLNQYMAVDDFVPQFDDDGNQTLVKTTTGIWQVQYNAENRPILWENGDKIITMSYDRMGRRVTKNNQHFIYDGYLQIANCEHSNENIEFQTFIWDPTELVATRPLVWGKGAGPTNLNSEHSNMNFYIHDGNKNVSDIVTSTSNVIAHYEYAPFGAVSLQGGASATANPWRFSSEYAEDDTATMYYNYRHYESVMCRWLSRDPGGELMSRALYVFCGNDAIYGSDYLGMNDVEDCQTEANASATFNFSINVGLGELSGAFGGTKTVQRCQRDCTPCKRGYTIKTTITWFGTMGGTWGVVLPPPLPPLPLDVGYSLELDKTKMSFYDSCTGEQQFKQCATFSVSVFAGKCFSIGPWIKHCFSVDGTYSYSDCNSKPNEFSIGVSWQQCYGWKHAGACVSTRWSPWSKSW